jgi:hypothetical protein
MIWHLPRIILDHVTVRFVKLAHLNSGNTVPVRVKDALGCGCGLWVVGCGLWVVVVVVVVVVVWWLRSQAMQLGVGLCVLKY